MSISFLFFPWRLLIKERGEIKCNMFSFHYFFLIGRKLTLSKTKVETLRRLQPLANVRLWFFSIDLFIPPLSFPTTINKKWLRLCLAGQVDIFCWAAWWWARKTLNGSATLLWFFSYFMTMMGKTDGVTAFLLVSYSRLWWVYN